MNEAQPSLYALTSPQREIWFDQILHEGIPLYNVGGYIKIPGAINPGLFEQAVNLLVQKHDTLRTVLTETADEDGVPMQTYAEKLAVTVPLCDFSTKAEPHESAMAWMQQRFEEPFELTEQPLFRYNLVKISEYYYYWFRQYHHLIVDNYAGALLHHSLAEIYTSLANELIPNLDSLSYTAFIDNDRAYVESAVFDKQRQYWLSKYPTSPEPLFNPRYRSNYTNKLIGSGCEVLYLPRDFYNRLNELAKQHNATLFHLLLGAFYVYFTRTAQRDDFAIGLPVLNRANANFKKTVGLFTGVSPTLFNFGKDLSFAELLQQINKTLKADHHHQRFPASEINRAVGLSTERSQLFDINLSYENFDDNAYFAGVNGQFIPLRHNYEQIPLMISVHDYHIQSDIKLDFVFNLAYFNTDDIKAQQARFVTILEAILKDNISPIYTLPIMTEQEVQQLQTWNDTTTDFPKNQTIVDLFEQQVEKTPNNIAVVFEEQQLTYRELNRQANQLAHYLQNKRVKPEVLVGICVERSLEMVIGLLGILKAGGAYVPIDPSYPAARIQYMLEDSATPLLLTQNHLKKQLFEPKPECVVVCFDEVDFAVQETDNPVVSNGVDDLAYVIYTSGSTGKPKGVMVEHKNLVNLITWHVKTFSVKSTDKATLLANTAFDASVWELWPNLIVGACVMPADLETLIEKDIWHWLNEKQISLSFLPTPVIDNYSATSVPNTTHLRLLLTGGDTLHQCPNTLSCPLFNNYGPTENTVVTTSTLVKPNVSSSIGKPIHNVQVYIVDAQHQILPPGIPGELCIVGAGLARGYLNRPELTAEKFIEIELFGKTERIYKTGDLARWLPDGNLEYLGRIDNQVKIRGFRIELGEIEAVLAQHPLVTENAVIVHEASKTDKRLVAYLVPFQGQVLENTALRTFLIEKLPDYMIPSAFVTIDTLPLTPNGKIDRRTLSQLSVSHEISEKPFVAPRTPDEELLANLWSKLLKVKQVGVHDNFFELGGHSLLAMQVLLRLRERFDVEVSLQELFEFSTIAELAQHINNESNARISRVSSQAIQPISRQQKLPLSAFQEPLWFLVQMNPDIPFYNESIAIHINSSVNVVALEQSFNAIIKRHEILRTTFTMVDGQPVQNIMLPSTLKLAIIDLRTIPDEQKEVQALGLANQQAKQLFDLTQAPLVRVILVQLDKVRFRLFVALHHIITDGFSLYNLFMQELITFYKAFSTGQSIPTPELPIQYADFAAWQWQQTFEEQLSYWKTILGNNLPRLQLPTDYPRPANPTFRGAKQNFTLSQSLITKIKHLNQQEGVTLFMTLLATFNTLLYRYTGQDDMVIGSFADCHNRSELDNVMGYFINTLVLRTDMSGNPTFKQLLARVREVTLGAYSHHDLPFQQLVEALNPARHPDQNPFFEVALTLEPPIMSALDSDLDWKLCQYDDGIDTSTARLDLSVEFEERSFDIIGRIEYRTDLFEKATIERIIGHFQTLLEGIVANPLARISELPLLTERERHQLSVEWNNTQTDYPKDKCIHQLFETQVETTPEAVAVVFEEQQLTYRKLNSQANQLAHYLQSMGVKPEVLVGICVERSIEMVIGLLGILKAGGAYVPLDPDYPQERLQFMLEDSSVAVLLSQSHMLERLPVSTAKVVCLDSEWEQIAAGSGENPLRQSGAENLAYVIYTSGSTGVPKGVMVEHRNVLAMLYGFEQVAKVRYPLRGISVCPFSFDLSVWEFFINLCFGGTLHLVDLELLIHPTNFVDYLFNQQINCTYIPPALLAPVVKELETRPFEVTLQRLLIGVEPIKQGLIQRYRDLSPNLNIINGYGPTETTICATFYHFIQVDKSERQIPIGKPVQGYQIYLMDYSLQPSPIGIPGELCIAGAGLARGYLNRPELTAEKFIEIELFGKHQRLYKTGDLARWLPDGNLEYLGRLDHQVKLRGFRIELGEIETVLKRHSAVKEAVVTLCEAGDNKRLVAYLTTDSKSNELVVELKDSLKANLPDYMVPSHFTVLDKLPLTPNGKIDRKALPAPEVESTTGIKPQTPTEELLAGLWTSVLKCEAISRDDNFFELGGHSLLATQLIAHIRDAFQVELPVREVFEHPILCELAEQITQIQTSNLNAPQSSFIKITKLDMPTNTALPISLTELELWLMEQLYPHAADMYYLPLNFRFVGPLNVARLEKSLMQMAQHHEVLRNGFIREDDKVIRVIPEIFTLPFENIDLRKIPTTEREAAARQQLASRLTQPLNLAQGPLWRCVLWHINEDEYWFLFVIHHIISDGWSMGVIAQEIAQHYRTLTDGLPITPTEATFEYKHFAAWQWYYFNSEKVLQYRNYWRTVLKEPPPPLIFPDSPHPAERKFIGDAYLVKLAPALLAELYQLTRQTESTLFITLLTAFKLLLFAYTQRHDLIVGTPLANRTQTEFENEIGFFVNTLPIRTDLSGNPSIHELLLRVMESTMGVIAHQQTPFIKVLEWVQPQKATGHAQLHQILFALQNTPEIHLFFGEKIKVSELPLPQTDHTVEFDLFMSLEETPDGIIGGLLYRKDLFSQAWIANFCEDYQNILQRLVAMFDEPIETLLKDIGIKTEIPQTTQDVKITSTSMNQPDLPQTETEQFLMAMWQDILGTTVLSIYDDFFEVGGSSLQLLMLLNQIEHTFACNISVRALFENTTIHQQSQLIVSIK